MKPESYHLGRILSKSHIEKGASLLHKQIRETGYGFRCLDLAIYRKEKYATGFDSDAFWRSYVARDVFYNHPGQFYNLSYDYPKSPFGVRSFDFTSHALQILYYSLGFFALDLVDDFLSDLRGKHGQNSDWSTFYGGRLNGQVPGASEIYYQEDYRAFNRNIKNTARKFLKKGKVGVVQLDVLNFFPSVRHEILIDVLTKYSKPSVAKRLGWNEDGQQAALDLLHFIKKANRGLPLSRQNLVSNFFAHLYLLELDDCVHELAGRYPEIVGYHRYVDDFFIFLSFDDAESKEHIGRSLLHIPGEVSDFLSENLGLRLNPKKCERHLLENAQELKTFLSKSRFVSFMIPLQATKVPPSVRLDEILDVVRGMKEEFADKGIVELGHDDEGLLKESFRKGFKTYLDKPSAKKALDAELSKWPPILTLYNVKALLFLLGKSDKGFTAFEDYLKKHIHAEHHRTHFCYLLESYLHHDRSGQVLHSTMKNAPRPYSTFFTLLKRMIWSKMDSTDPRFPFPDDAISADASLGQQVKKAVLSEGEGSFNVAFNHMLNAFHVYCMHSDPRSIPRERYTSSSVTDFLRPLLSPAQLRFVTAFFDRRNKNTLSHPGDPTMENWVVVESEYERYRDGLKPVVAKIVTHLAGKAAP